MSYTLDKIRMVNFKLFEDQTIQLDKDFSILTGPNGFGKSSIFDAIEFLITGKIRRYDHYREAYIDGRNIAAEQCFIKRKASDVNAETYVEVTFCSSADFEDRLIFHRTLDLGATGYDLQSKLSRIDQNESELVPLNEKEQEAITKKLGFEKNYGLLHYIEQDETSFQIKKKHSERSKGVAHLFGMENQENELEKFKELRRKFRAVQDEIKQILKNKEDQLNGLTQQNDPNVSCEYVKLFKDIDTLWWDELDVSIKDVESLASVKTLLDALARVLNDETSVKHFRIVNSINALLQAENKLQLIVDYAKYTPHLVSYNDIRTRYQSESQMRAFITLKFPLDLGDDATLQALSPLMNDEHSRNEFNRLQNQRKSLNELSTALLTTNQLRQQLIKHHEQHFTEQDTCPLCGYSWESAERLQAQFDTSLDNLKGYRNSQTFEYENRIHQFFENYILPLQVTYTNKLSEEMPLSDEYFYNLTQFVNNYSDERYADLQSSTLAPLTLSLETVNVSDFKNQLEGMKQAYPLPPSMYDDMHLIYSGDENLYNILFNASTLPMLDAIEEKKRYIQYCFQRSTDDRYQKILKYLEHLKSSQTKLEDHLNNLGKLLKVYDEVFKQYKSDLTNQVGRLFHIYSGRIMNDHQNGMGLFMNSEEGKITFHETSTAVNEDHDALFSLSSGQINALVLSFMLTMHQTYAKNPLLCIDDPMQTFDDINAVGLINLLRYEFKGNQILLSTHESGISALITYKFQRFNFSTKPINLHDLKAF